MKVLFSHNVPFHLAHGGLQTQIEALMRELTGLGVEVEPERWWDDTQRGDLLQFFGRPPFASVVRFAHQKGMRVAMFENLDNTASRPPSRLRIQRLLTRVAGRLLRGLTDRLGWECYRELDAMIYATELEWRTAKYLFNARPERGHVIGHGLEPAAIRALRQPAAPGDYLVSVATITGRKNSVLLAEAARQAQVPVVFLGRPYSEADEYFRQFQALVDDRHVRYPGFVTEAEKQRLLAGARGFVLWSRFESGCIAVYEAAAAGLPMLLPDLPWAARVYGDLAGIEFTPLGTGGLPAGRLKAFHAAARRREQPIFPVPTWREVAERYLRIYEQVVAGTR